MIKKKIERYQRIINQLRELFEQTDDPLARMSTIAAILHHKFKYFFWTGFYQLIGENLIVACYQGSLACLILEKNKGVCWKAINTKEIVIVPDVTKFPDHIACDSRSRSEIVVPIKNSVEKITAVLDVDSRELNTFDEIDAKFLQKIVRLIHN